jgi:FSR family fosmidomycin resistance protein-like MFS transporter
MEKFPWVMIAGLLTSVMLYFKLNDITTQSQTEQVSISWRENLPKIKQVLLPLMLLIITRGMISSALTIFLPTYLTNQGVKFWVSGVSLTIFEVSGMTGAFLVGSLSDRFGRYKMLLISTILTPILMVLFLLSSTAWKIPVLILLGFSLISVVPVIMAIVMENFNENRSFANGVYMAVSFVIGSIGTILVGLLSDLLKMQTTFMISAGLVILGLPIIFWLTKSAKKRRETQSS